MKVRIEIESSLTENEVLIRCGSLDESVINLQRLILEQGNTTQCLLLDSGETEYYVPLSDIYFFETQGREIIAHSADKLFHTSYKLYELEELLPGNFMRISKSTITNLDYIYSITRNLTASSVVEFTGSVKKVLVSRNYYKALIDKLALRRVGRMCRKEEEKNEKK